jgi:hypothetical protein
MMGQGCQSSHERVGEGIGNISIVGGMSGVLVSGGKVGVGGRTFMAVACVPQAAVRNTRKKNMRRREVCTGIPLVIPLTAYPAIIGGAAKDQLRGRREF